MKNIYSIFILSLLSATSIFAAATTQPATKPSRPGPQITRLTLHPMATTRPALKYELLPNVVDQTPGNAAQLYFAAFDTDVLRIVPGTTQPYEQLDNYLEFQADKLPIQKVAAFLKKYKITLDYLDLAAHREYCRWDMPIRQDGYKVLLPYLNSMAGLVQLVELQTTLHIAQKNWPAAAHSLQIGLAAARSLNNRPLLVQSMVAMYNAQRMLGRVDEWVAQPDAPNLYWPLSNLPNPFVDLSNAMEWEIAQYYFSIPLLKQARQGKLTSDQWRRMEQDIWNILQHLSKMTINSQPFPGQQLGFDQYIAMAQPHAKAWLIATGQPKQKVEAMNQYQAVGLYWLETYRDWSDEIRKGWSLPYWQIASQVNRTYQELKKTRKETKGNLMLELIPSVDRVPVQNAMLDRHIALLRTVEALRDYAARHEGRPPVHLSDIKNLPIPIDPMTGKPFIYHATGRSAVLESPSPDPRTPYLGRRYELTFAD